MSDNDWGNWGELVGVAPEQLIAMANQRALDDLDRTPSHNNHRNVINMLRHDYTNYDGHVVNATSDRCYAEVLDEIARDFPWLAPQCEIDKATHSDRVPLVQQKVWDHRDRMEHQRRGREAAKNLRVGMMVTVKWRGRLRAAEIIEVRRSLVRVRFTVNGADQVIDRPADEVQPIAD